MYCAPAYELFGQYLGYTLISSHIISFYNIMSVNLKISVLDIQKFKQTCTCLLGMSTLIFWQYPNYSFGSCICSLFVTFTPIFPKIFVINFKFYTYMHVCSMHIDSNNLDNIQKYSSLGIHICSIFVTFMSITP